MQWIPYIYIMPGRSSSASSLETVGRKVTAYSPHGTVRPFIQIISPVGSRVLCAHMTCPQFPCTRSATPMQPCSLRQALTYKRWPLDWDMPASRPRAKFMPTPFNRQMPQRPTLYKICCIRWRPKSALKEQKKNKCCRYHMNMVKIGILWPCFYAI